MAPGFRGRYPLGWQKGSMGEAGMSEQIKFQGREHRPRGTSKARLRGCNSLLGRPGSQEWQAGYGTTPLGHVGDGLRAETRGREAREEA